MGLTVVMDAEEALGVRNALTNARLENDALRRQVAHLQRLLAGPQPARPPADALDLVAQLADERAGRERAEMRAYAAEKRLRELQAAEKARPAPPPPVVVDEGEAFCPRPWHVSQADRPPVLAEVWRCLWSMGEARAPQITRLLVTQGVLTTDDPAAQVRSCLQRLEAEGRARHAERGWYRVGEASAHA